MIRLTIGSIDLQKWLHQNGAFVEDLIEGILLDNSLEVCKRGYAAIYEHALNEWSSNYIVEFETGLASNVFDRWNKFVEQARANELKEGYRHE